MLGNASYLAWTAVFGWIPNLLLLALSPRPILKHRATILKVTAIVAVLSVLWDNAAVTLGVWRFHPDRVVGVYLLRSPIETLLLAITVAIGVSALTSVIYERGRFSLSSSPP